MAEINLLFEFVHDDGLDQVARSLQDQLRRLEMVAEVEATPEQMRLTGLEIAAAIGVTVLIVRGGRELVEEVRKLVTEIKGLMVGLRDLKDVYVDLGAQRIPIDHLAGEHFQQLVQ